MGLRTELMEPMGRMRLRLLRSDGGQREQEMRLALVRYVSLSGITNEALAVGV